MVTKGPFSLSDQCGGELTGERGKIRATTEPLADCEWIIKLEKGYRVFLTFTKFHVPTSPGKHNGNLTSIVRAKGKRNDDVEVDTGLSHGNMTCDANYVDILIGNEKVSLTPTDATISLIIISDHNSCISGPSM